MKSMSKTSTFQKALTVSLAAGAVVAAFALQSSPAQAQSATPSMTSGKLKACFVYIGPRGDIGSFVSKVRRLRLLMPINGVFS